jgi:ribosomal protein L11 methyltransferase
MFYRIGNLVIRSPLSIRKPRMGEDCLVLKTARSFPPAHPSTRAALTVLHRLQIESGAGILDIGCGSGILGLSAALKSKGSALGCDVSPGAIQATLHNVRLNRMEDRFHFFRGSADSVSGRFDLILANLHAVIHTELFDHYQRLLPLKGDLLVASGFFDVQAGEVEKELVQRGFRVVERVQIHASTPALTDVCSDTWVGFGFKRVAARP